MKKLINLHGDSSCRTKFVTTLSKQTEVWNQNFLNINYDDFENIESGVIVTHEIPNSLLDFDEIEGYNVCVYNGEIIKISEENSVKYDVIIDGNDLNMLENIIKIMIK